LIDVESVSLDWGDGHTDTVSPPAYGKTTLTHTYTYDGDREMHAVATFTLANGQIRRARSRLQTWSHSPPMRIAPYGGGKSGGSTYRTDDTASGKHGNSMPAPDYGSMGP